MHKRILIVLLLILSFFSFTICYANDDMQKAGQSAQNTLDNAGKTVENAAKGTGEMLKDATNAAKDGASKAGNAVKDGANAVGNTVEKGANNAKNAIQNTMNGNTNYETTRTAGEGTFMGMTSNTWSWLILGIAAIAIIALVWYYSTQINNNKHYDNHE